MQCNLRIHLLDRPHLAAQRQALEPPTGIAISTDVASNIVQPALSAAIGVVAGTYPAMVTTATAMDPDMMAAMGTVGAAAGAADS
jgi:hypothetical protein